MTGTAGDAGAARARVALVTGGTGGMGRVIAARLAADGFDVAVAHTGEIDLAGAAVSEIKEQGRNGAAFAADIADEQEVAALFDAAQDRFGRLDGLRQRRIRLTASESPIVMSRVAASIRRTPAPISVNGTYTPARVSASE